MPVRQTYEERGVIIGAIDIDFYLFIFFIKRIKFAKEFLRALNMKMSRKKLQRLEGLTQLNHHISKI